MRYYIVTFQVYNKYSWYISK